MQAHVVVLQKQVVDSHNREATPKLLNRCIYNATWYGMHLSLGSNLKCSIYLQDVAIARAIQTFKKIEERYHMVLHYMSMI